jgi:hypothetical protein
MLLDPLDTPLNSALDGPGGTGGGCKGLQSTPGGCRICETLEVVAGGYGGSGALQVVFRLVHCRETQNKIIV